MGNIRFACFQIEREILDVADDVPRGGGRESSGVSVELCIEIHGIDCNAMDLSVVQDVSCILGNPQARPCLWNFFLMTSRTLQRFS